MASEHSKRKKPMPGSLRLFVSYEKDRVTLDVGQDQSVQDLKEVVREVFHIGSDEGPAGAEVQERKILTLVYAGSDLDNSWILTDLGILSGSTIKAVLKDEVKPSMFVFCVFNGDTIPLFEKINTRTMDLERFRSLVSRKSGLPVSVFRLMSHMEHGKEMFDSHTLDDYGVGLGDTVRLETWDGWTDFLNLAISGFASHVMANLSTDEMVSRFQMKVALYIAAHFGHVDLSVSLLRQGMRADEAVGEHPKRLWCKKTAEHIDCKKAPVHEAAEAGQLGVLRSFVHNNVTNVLAKDGNDLTALNISLRRQQKACASFLLTKQWNKVNFNKKSSIPLSIFCKMKRWADKAKDKVLNVHGQWKSSVKNPRRYGNAAALLDHGLQLDGFSKSKLASKTASASKLAEEQEERSKKLLFDCYEEERKLRTPPSPDVYFKTLGTMNTLKLPRLNRIGKMLTKVVQEQTDKKDEGDAAVETADTESNQLSPEPKKKTRPRSRSESRAEQPVRLPPINEKSNIGQRRHISLSHQNLTTGSKSEKEFRGNTKIRKSRSVYLKTPFRQSETNNDKEDSEETLDQNKKKEGLMKSPSSTRVQRETGVSVAACPRPFVRSKSEDLTRGTLALYEKYRGQTSRDYALKCLSVAHSFKEKAWLQQVNQAMVIARKGVKKIVDRQPNIFNPSISQLSSSSHCAGMSSIQSKSSLTQSSSHVMTAM